MAVKGVALHSAEEQTKLCKNALFTCRYFAPPLGVRGCMPMHVQTSLSFIILE